MRSERSEISGATVARSSANSSGRWLSAARAQAAKRLARPNGDCLGRGEGKFGLPEDVERLVRLRRQFAIFANPARQHGLGGLFNPLFEQCADFFAQMGGVIQARKLEAFERGV